MDQHTRYPSAASRRLLPITAFLAAALLILSAPAAAQLSKVGEVFLDPADSARGVSVELPYAYVGLFTDGIQKKVDLTVPTLPSLVTTFNPAFGDEWAENFVYNGKLICGHRFGGLNLWDVTGAPAVLDTASTTYHFDGLDVHNPPGEEFLVYSEHNASSAPAGIRVYDILGGSLTYASDDLLGSNLRDGRFLIVTRDGWVYQLDGGAGSTRPLTLNIYDLDDPYAPVSYPQFDMGNAVGSYAGLTDLELDPFVHQVLYAACGFDGLRSIDISVRSAPVVVDTIGAPGFYVRELSFLENSVYLIASVLLPSGQWRFRVLNCTIPTAPVVVGGWLGDPNYVIHDLRATWLTGPAVLVAGQNSLGQASLQVWM